MRILADQYLYALDQLLNDKFDLTTFDPDKGLPEDVHEYDVLLIRSVTNVDAESLPVPGNLKFVGSATAGFDHVDVEYLNQNGVTFTRSEGCNANAVAEYVITVLYRWAHAREVDLEDFRIGIVGCGNTGGSVIEYLEKLDIAFVPYDPPKSERESSFQSASLDELLACDILSFHTPLTQTGPHATFHLCSYKWLRNEFRLIVNASRGGVVDEPELFKAFEAGTVDDFILDVWEGEPVYSDRMANHSMVSTPHIAGYSREAKWRASEMVINKMIDFFELDYDPPEFEESPDMDASGVVKNLSFADFLWNNHLLSYYDQKLRRMIGLNDERKALEFAELRSTTTPRFEFGTIIEKFPKDQLPGQAKIFLKDF